MRYLSTWLLLISLSLLSINAQASVMDVYAIVDDPDGYVNVRKSDNLKSDVLTTISSGTVVSAYCNPDDKATNFCMVFAGDGELGYVYSNRLSFFEENDDFISIPFVDNSLSHNSNNVINNLTGENYRTSAYAYNSEYKVGSHIKLQPITLNPNKLNNSHNLDEGCPDYYSGRCSFGLEGLINLDNQDKQYFQLGDISFYIDDNVIPVAKEALKNIYFSEFFVAKDLVFKNTILYFNPDTKQSYLVSNQGDGAGVFSLIFVMNHTGELTKHIWSDAL